MKIIDVPLTSRLIKTYKEKTKSKIRAKKYIWQLRSSMMRNLGIVRNQKSIIRGLFDILKIERESNGLSAKLNDMILVSKFIILGAYKREESRGCHLRSDYTQQNDNMAYHIDQTLSQLESGIKKMIDQHNVNDDEKVSIN